MKLSIVIPFYNEENMIQKMYDALVAEVNKITKAEFEIIFINDGSKDRTFEKCLRSRIVILASSILVSAETLGKKLEQLQDLNTQQGKLSF